MNLKITPGYILSFLLLLIVMLEFHELVHITVGYMVCGCWGSRDFNVWGLCAQCANADEYGWIATLSGPVFSFAIMYAGMYLLNSVRNDFRSFGFALIFTSIPFGRITNVMMGGGDEMVVIRHFLKNDFSRSEMILSGTIIILLIILPPLIKAYRAITNKHAWAYVCGFLMLPLVFLLTYTLGLMNSLLSNGVLSKPVLMGTPLLITVHTMAALIGFFIIRRKLSQGWE